MPPLEIRKPFTKKKPDGTLRFFVLGASSAIGFPYMHNGAFPRMLKYKLQFLFPQNNIEIINVSLTAINTYTLYDFSRQLVDYQPDCILIYAGHTEYYGALGIASSSRLGRNHQFINLMLAAKKLKLMQGLTRLAENIRPGNSTLTDQDLTLMERMAAHQMIPYQSEEYNAGIEQFDRNLGDMLHLFQKHHIPVFIGTLVSNLKGQMPLSKDSSPLYNAQEEYALGKQAYDLGLHAEALQHYMQAKEYDQLRFRAPEAFNQIIRKYGDELDNVYVVDILKKFTSNSPNGIPGSELLLEHVHPNLTGQRLIAETFYEALSDHFFTPGNRQPSGYNINLKEYPATAFDSIYGDMVIARLKQQWPFNEAPHELNYDKESFEYKTAELFFYQKINWGQAMQRLNNHYIISKDNANALRIVEQMCLELPHEKVFQKQAGSLSIQLKEKEKAAFYFKQAEKP